MGKKRVLCGYGIDVDAVSGWINTRDGSRVSATDVSRGCFGGTVGTERLLKLWDEYNIKTTWFIPGHSIESFPETMAKVRDAGHEIGLHGYTHEFVGTMSEKQQRDILTKSIDVLTTFCGKKPRGWTAPAWDTSPISIKLLEEYGIEYDHSKMDHDCQPYYVSDHYEYLTTDYSKEAETWMQPMKDLKPSTIVEIPADWHKDDWPALNPHLGKPAHGYVDTYVIEKQWLEAFDYYYEHYDSFIFPMSIHPQVSGKGFVMKMHERIIKYLNSKDGVEWMTFEQMVDEFKAGRIGGEML